MSLCSVTENLVLNLSRILSEVIIKLKNVAKSNVNKSQAKRSVSPVSGSLPLTVPR